MNVEGWVQRTWGSQTRPGLLKSGDAVEYKLLGDSKVYDGAAGELNWGAGSGANNEGWISAWRKVALVAADAPRPHAHYFKDVAHLTEVDVYRVLDLFRVAHPAIAHAAKKLLVAGGRGAGKDIGQDVQEAIDALQRWQEMDAEDQKLRRV